MEDSDWADLYREAGFVDELMNLDRMLDELLPSVEADVKERELEYQDLIRIDRLEGPARKAAMRELEQQVRDSNRELRELRKVQSKAVRELIREGYTVERIAKASGLTLEAIRDLALRRWRWLRRVNPTTKGRPQ